LNVRAAFSVSDPTAVAGKHVLLIDDIFTTGATARAASQALVRAGAASVFVATLARARLVNEFSRGAFFDGAEDNSTNSPAATVQPASIYSSQDQPSF
jgi:hypoxanthine-guanine phosphoribosyltransferase